jgi:hypothetical protein
MNRNSSAYAKKNVSVKWSGLSEAYRDHNNNEEKTKSMLWKRIISIHGNIMIGKEGI